MAPMISADGNRIVFLSTANNLVTNDSQGAFLDVFTYSIPFSEMRLVSKSRFGAAGGDGNSAFPAISSNGAWIVYSSEAENLVAGGTNFLSDVFLHNVGSSSNVLLSTAFTGQMAQGPTNGPPINGSVRPAMSMDASRVVFESTARDLVTNDVNSAVDLFVRDVFANRTTKVNGTNTAPLACSVTADGRRAVYLAREHNMVGVFVRDFTTDARIWVSARLTNLYAPSFPIYSMDHVCHHPLISNDGNVVVFKATRDSVPNSAMLFRYEIDTDTLTGIVTNTPHQIPASMSSDGRFVAFDWFTNSSAIPPQIFVWDALTRARDFVSLNAAGTAPAQGPSEAPVISADGRFIAFLSKASNVVAGTTLGQHYQLFLRDTSSGITRLVSFNTNREPSASGARHSAPSLNADGMRLVFDYAGNDMAADDYNEAADVFLYEWEHDRLTLISRAQPSRPAATTALGVTAELHSTSADGSSVAFTSFSPGSRDGWIYDGVQGRSMFLASNAVQPLLSANGRYAVFIQQAKTRISEHVVRETNHVVRMDLTSGVSELVDPDPLVRTNSLLQSRPFGLAVSGDGRLVLYEKTNHLYLKDMNTGSNHLVTVNSDGAPAAGACWYPLMSPDHRWVAFQCTQPLTTEPVQSSVNLYGRDLQSQETFLVSRGLRSASVPISFDATGRFLAFDGYQTSLPYQNVYLYDHLSRSNRLICTNCFRPQLSSGAAAAVYGSGVGSTSQVALLDLTVGTELLIASNLMNRGNSSPDPVITADGRFVVFSTLSSNLVSGDHNGVRDIYLRDRYTRRTTLLSSALAPGNGPSGHPVLSRDGRTLVFQTFAGNLTEGDQNQSLDLVSIQLGVGDADRDGMDDNWEMTFFSNLQPNGSEDYDGDGQSNLGEFIAGTDPTNSGSVLEVTVIRSLQTGNITVLWPFLKGRQYVVQSKPNALDSSWRNISPVLPDRQTSTRVAQTNSPMAFYRVALVH